MITVSLEIEDILNAHKLSAQRNNKHPQYNKKFDITHTDIEIHFMAAVAEIAWANLSGWEVDTSIRWGDEGIDFHNNGNTYQLKTRDTSRYKKPDLLCRVRYVKADRFILSELEPDDPYIVNFIGWCTQKELKRSLTNIRGKGTRYIRNRHLLRELPDYLENKNK